MELSNRTIEKIAVYFRHPSKIVVFLQNRCNFKILPDKTYLKIKYKLATGKKLDLKNPQTFNEKLQWLKLYDRKPEYTRMVDKYEAKKYVAEKIGEEYIIPTLGVWNHFDEIDFDALPDQFVLKCTHDSGGLVIVRDKDKLDKVAAKKKIEKSLKRNYYFSGREWPYKDVKPRIIAEKYMEDFLGEGGLIDYKFFCFRGLPQIMFITQETNSEPEIDFYNMHFEHLSVLTDEDRNALRCPEKPNNWEEMKRIAMVLSENIPHLRVDFYNINKKLYVGELTFFHCGGMAIIKPDEWNQIMGRWIDLDEVKSL